MIRKFNAEFDNRDQGCVRAMNYLILWADQRPRVYNYQYADGYNSKRP